MSKVKSQAVKLNKVELTNLPNVGVLVVKVDGRKNNTGRPVDKTSARYKRLAKQAKYALRLSKFTQGDSFKLNKEKSEQYKYSVTSGNEYGCIVSTVTGYVCNVSYIGRTKVQAFTFVLGRKVNVTLNLKTLVFVS